MVGVILIVVTHPAIVEVLAIGEAAIELAGTPIEVTTKSANSHSV